MACWYNNRTSVIKSDCFSSVSNLNNSSTAFMAKIILFMVLMVVWRTLKLEWLKKGNKRGKILWPLRRRMKTAWLCVRASKSERSDMMLEHEVPRSSRSDRTSMSVFMRSSSWGWGRIRLSWVETGSRPKFFVKDSNKFEIILPRIFTTSYFERYGTLKILFKFPRYNRHKIYEINLLTWARHLTNVVVWVLDTFENVVECEWDYLVKMCWVARRCRRRRGCSDGVLN